MAVVLFINLPSPFLTNEKALMPLGLLYVAAANSRYGNPSAVLDLAGSTDIRKDVFTWLEDLEPDVVAIGTTTSQISIANEVANAVRVYRKGIKLVVGGPHVTHIFESMQRCPDRCHKYYKNLLDTYDTVVVGDAELAIKDAVKPASPKVIDATVRESPYYVSSAVMELMPIPARHLIDIRKYRYNLGMSKISDHNAISIMTQRGCPYSCLFCAGRLDQYGRSMRRISDKKIVYEIKHLNSEYGYTDFTFYDDEINANPHINSLLTELVELQSQYGGMFRFRAFVRSNICTKSQLTAMKEAGFIVVAIGAESGSNRILSNMSKKATVDDNTRVVETCHELGIYVKSVMSIGHPGETHVTLADTEKWLDKVKLDDVNFTIIECLPSSAYFDLAVKQGDEWVYTAESGDKLYDRGVDWLNEVHFFNGKSTAEYRPTIRTDALSSDDLLKAHAYFEQKYK